MCRFVNAEPRVVDLHPGQVLFIPALWHHHVTTLTPSKQPQLIPSQEEAAVSGSEAQLGWSASVNVFWRHLDACMYDRKDVYGNKDLVSAAAADVATQEARKQLQKLPEPYQSFYTQRCMQQLAAGTQLQEVMS